ncbi:uncharacterized protein METZ01_LOCUS295336, partial [marine metagenome]
NKAHSKKSFNGKLKRVTTHAVDIPKTRLRDPTPNIRASVLDI